jgi:1,4-dihydroxy-2-naphthoyl-CoA synthase
VPSLPLADLLVVARSPLAHDALGIGTDGGVLVADLRSAGAHERVPEAALAGLAVVLVAIGDPTHPAARAFDVVVPDDAAGDTVVAAVEARPIAATALALLLRGGQDRTVVEGLVAESSTYSTLQSGPEHAAWRTTRAQPSQTRRRVPTTDPVRIARDDGLLHLTLDRPEVRNAYDAATRDALLDALAVATADPTIGSVLLDGAGPGFCSGGDLDEFGTLSDPASAHLLRLSRSVARALHELRDRTTVRVHGACLGAGVELPAFASHVVAHPHTTFSLPEIAMGLVPGAGGTVSIPRRIGRQRTAWWAITGTTIDAATALAWNLVDTVEDWSGAS